MIFWTHWGPKCWDNPWAEHGNLLSRPLSFGIYTCWFYSKWAHLPMWYQPINRALNCFLEYFTYRHIVHELYMYIYIYKLFVYGTHAYCNMFCLSLFFFITTSFNRKMQKIRSMRKPGKHSQIFIKSRTRKSEYVTIWTKTHIRNNKGKRLRGNH